MRCALPAPSRKISCNPSLRQYNKSTTISALTQDNKLLNAYDDIVKSGYEGGIDMCRITTEIEERGIRRGIKRGEEQALNVVAGVVRAYHRTGSVAAAAKENNLTEEYTRTILQKLEMLLS